MEVQRAVIFYRWVQRPFQSVALLSRYSYRHYCACVTTFHTNCMVLNVMAKVITTTSCILSSLCEDQCDWVGSIKVLGMRNGVSTRQQNVMERTQMKPQEAHGFSLVPGDDSQLLEIYYLQGGFRSNWFLGIINFGRQRYMQFPTSHEVKDLVLDLVIIFCSLAKA